MLAWLQLRQGRLDEAGELLQPLLADDAPLESGAAVLASPAVLVPLAAAAWGDRISECAQRRLRRWAALFAAPPVEAAPRKGALAHAMMGRVSTMPDRAGRRAAPKPARVPSGDRPRYSVDEGLH
jgi:hypothetical protein